MWPWEQHRRKIPTGASLGQEIVRVIKIVRGPWLDVTEASVVCRASMANIIKKSHMPLCISMISGVCVQGMWNAQVKGQVTETHRLKVNSHCDTALFISMYDITMVQP